MAGGNSDDVDKDAPNTPIIPLDPEVEVVLLVLLLLILSFWVSYYLKVRRIKSIHETIVALLAGCFVGLIVRLSPGTVVQEMISFKNTILLNVLLPPIILNSGFELRQANFFRNFGVILAFAFAGTFISAVVLGVLVYIWALLGLEGLSLSIVECLIFGSTLSATDPVTILAIFNALKVDPKLYSIIFGESILNDAVAIVMFETLSQFHGEKIHILSFFHGVGIFLLIFLTSMALGVVFGLACSLMLKHSRLNEYPEIESCLIILIAYTSYFFSNGLTMSGIVSLLFCGITLKHYAYHNMSKRSQRTSKYIFSSLAQLCENFIFIYLGLSLFTQTDLVYKPLFILVTAVAVVAARWMAVFPLAKLINVVFRARGQRSEELPQSYQMMLFWAGLRGAVGVALAAGIKGHNAKSLRTTVLVTVVISLVVFGGTVGRMIEIVGIRTGVQEDDDGESSDEEGPQLGTGGYRAAATGDSPYMDRYRNESMHSLHAGNGKRFSPNSRSFRRQDSPEDSDEDDPEVLPSATSGTFDNNAGGPGAGADGGEEGAVWRDGQWFNVLDEQYLLPVFSNATASRRQASRKAMRSSARLGMNDSRDEEDMGSERDLGSARTPTSPWDGHQSSGSVTAGGSGRVSPSETALGNGGVPQRNNTSRGFVHFPSSMSMTTTSPTSTSATRTEAMISHRSTPSLGAALSSLLSLSTSSAPPTDSSDPYEALPESSGPGRPGPGRIGSANSDAATTTKANNNINAFLPSSINFPSFNPILPPLTEKRRRNSSNGRANSASGDLTGPGHNDLPSPPATASASSSNTSPTRHLVSVTQSEPSSARSSSFPRSIPSNLMREESGTASLYRRQSAPVNDIPRSNTGGSSSIPGRVGNMNPNRGVRSSVPIAQGGQATPAGLSWGRTASYSGSSTTNKEGKERD